MNPLILIPAYNEEQNIARVVNEIRALGYDTLVIDDGSTDKTPEILQTLDTHFLINSPNKGKGASLRLGFQWFLEHPYEFLVMMDADGQHEAREIPRFIEKLRGSGADLVVGNRLGDPVGMPKLRQGTNRLMSWLISRVAGQKIEDSQCGFRAMSRAVIEKIALRRDRFETESEILLEASHKGFKIVSIPIRSVYAGEGSHIHPIRDTLRFIQFISSYILTKS